jgi:hypothetical protein
MTTRPILFSGPMVRALLDGRKTQTRRVLKPTAEAFETPKFRRGDVLWVREAWCDVNDHGIESVAYRADGDVWGVDEARHDTLADKYLYATWAADLIGGIEGSWRPSIHMPRWASRLTLRVTDVRVQRVQEISEGDAVAEGIERDTDGWVDYQAPSVQCCVTARDSFMTLWDSLNAPRGYGWDANPWVAAFTFEVIRKNVDQITEERADAG